jgi:integrase
MSLAIVFRQRFRIFIARLPECMRPVVTFAYVTGWRVNSEVLPMQWRQVDLKAGEVRLDPGTTKNLEGRVFYPTPELKKLLGDQRKAANRLQRGKKMFAHHVFFHDGRTQAGEPIFEAGQRIAPSGFYHAWCRARVDAGRPGSIPHDLRRTAVRNMVRADIPRACRDEAVRAQDSERFRPAQHRQ